MLFTFALDSENNAPSEVAYNNQNNRQHCKNAEFDVDYR